MSRILLAGTKSNVGKTTITLGILRALKNRGIDLAPFKCGPDYIDPMFHKFASSKCSRNLDTFFLEKEVLKHLFIKNRQSSLAVVEGVMGLYDGDNIGVSTADLSKTLDLPVILIVDGSGVSSSAAAEVLGFKLYDTDVNIKGVIINKIHGERHYKLLKKPIEKRTGIKCLGYVNRNKKFTLESRHLGLVPSDEVEDLDKLLDEVAKSIEATVDLDQLVKIAKEVSVLTSKYQESFPTYDLKIAVAKDKAFNFYYEDNIDYLKRSGVNIVEFSPLMDDEVPEDIDGIYLGGGYPEEFAEHLSSNKSMLQSINAFAEENGPIYAECGGLMYLSKGIYDFSKTYYSFANIFDFEIEMTSRLQHFGYVKVTFDGIQTKGHEFHRSRVIEDQNTPKCYQIEKYSNESKTWKGGYRYKNVLAGYPHIHFYSNRDFVIKLLNQCEMYKKGRLYEE